MRSRTFLGIVIIVFLVAFLGLFAYELYSLVTPAQVPSSPVTAPATPTEVTSPSPATSPTPTIGQAITQAEKDIFDPITALLDFTAVSLIAILVIFLFQRIWHLTGQSNLVLDTFNNATGKDEVTKLLLGLNGITRERLAQVLEEVRKRINPNRQSGKKDAAQQDQEEFRLDRFPVPQQVSDEQLLKLLTTLKDVSTGNVSTAVQLLNLIFTPRGTRVTVTLQSKAETPSTLGISLEVVDLEGRQETKLRTIWEPAYMPESKSHAEPTTGSPSPPSTTPPPQAYYNVGRQLQTLGLFDDAIHYFEEALKRDKTFDLAAQAVAKCTSYAQVQKSGVTHGMRNEVSRAKEVTPERSWLHPWLRDGVSSRTSENRGRRGAGWVRMGHTILALLIYSEGESALLKKLHGVVSSSFVTSSLDIRERRQH